MSIMEEDFKDVGSRAEERLVYIEGFWNKFGDWIVHYGKIIWNTLTSLIGLVGTIMVAYAVQANPQHLSLAIREDKDISGVYDLVYQAATTSDSSMVFAVINDQLFHTGMIFLGAAFLCQFISIWGEDIFSFLRNAYKRLSSRW